LETKIAKRQRGNMGARKGNDSDTKTPDNSFSISDWKNWNAA
jgi:hypothetical protein